ncbi:iron-sulfur cluster assembly scaffold protein [Candidatus Pacearchaeota archaeon]|nr:iron-sulfur cluster assembly scaffold protein [Candidatus Pacearchaeota archaeon]|tara:strand:+ start:4194 stop:4565 length:372 start_codon:yes stop_codon:yes gene_type:complete
MYSEKIIERFRNPQFAGEIKDADAVGEEGNMKCGDIMKIFLKVENNVIVDIKFKTYGCMAAIASSDAMCELAKGMSVEGAEKITYEDIIEKMGGDVPEVKIHCSVLGTRALRNALKDYKKQQH